MDKVILVVEDEFLIALAYKEILERHGWRVIGPVATVRNALRVLAIELPLVALLDLNLRNERVTPVAVFLKSRQVPFALATADVETEEIDAAFAGVPNVGKPNSERDLIATLAGLTSH